MARPNLKNFASSTLAAAITTSTQSSFSVAAGQGAFFPTISSSLTLPYQPSQFVVAIDNELLLISARSGDTFTVAARGYYGTTPTTHSNGAAVLQADHTQLIDHIYGNVADAHNADVPPYARGSLVGGLWDYLAGGAPSSSYDDEFESWGGNGNPWSMSPGPTGGNMTDSGAVADIGTTLRSHFTFQRNQGVTGLYTLYRSFNPPGSTPYVVSAKLDTGSNANFGTFQYTIAGMFVSASNAPGGTFADGVGLQHVSGAGGTASDGAYVSTPVWQPLTYNSSGAYQVYGHDTAYFGQAHIRLFFDGSGTWTYLLSRDGLTYYILWSTTKSFVPATLGFYFTAFQGGNLQVAAIDYVRYRTVNTSGRPGDAYLP